MRSIPSRIVHVDPTCPVCAATTAPTLVVQAGPLPAPYPNPYHKNDLYGAPASAGRDGGPHGTYWYHGTKFSPYEDDETDEDTQNFGGRLKTPEDESGEYGARASHHWNTDLGVHFTAMHGVASDEFAERHGKQHHSRIAHATLHMRNPIHFKNEYEFSHDAAAWAHGMGYRYLPANPEAHDAFVNGNYDKVNEHDENEGNYRDYDYHRIHAHLSTDDRKNISALDNNGPDWREIEANEHWLGKHPDREKITTGYRQHLQLKGHDGVVYGNNYEGPFEHKCAIAFPETPIGIHKWEFLHPRNNRTQLYKEDPRQLKLFSARKPQVYYHGTIMPNVTHILPASQHGKWIAYPTETDKSYAYATKDLDNAWEYAGTAYGNHRDDHPENRDNPGRPRVYKVHAIDGDEHVEEDPDWDPIEQRSRGTHSDDMRSRKGFKVIEEMKPSADYMKWWHVKDKDNWFDRLNHPDGIPGSHTRIGYGQGATQAYAVASEDNPYTKSTAVGHGHGFAHVYATKQALSRAAAIRMVPPEEYRHFHYPDYPKAASPAALVKYFKKTSPEYYDKVKQDVQKNGFTTPVLVRWNDSGGRPLKNPHVMEGHHRAAVAHELGIHLPVGDYEDSDDCDRSAQSGRDWFSKNDRPIADMPRQGGAETRYIMQRMAKKRWMPHERLFGPTYGLDHRLFDGEHLKSDVRSYILDTLDAFWRPMYGPGWTRWARVFFAGSEASRWTSETLEGNNDFDILIGVDYDRLRAFSPMFKDKTNEDITSFLNQQFREGLDRRTDPTMITIDGSETGPWSNTWYINANSYDIRAIRPYAAYDVIADEWVVKPPDLPEWDVSKFPEGKGLAREIKGVIEMAKGILAMPEPYRTQNGAALWGYIHSTRSDAFGEQGEGWYDPRNVLEKALDQAGLMQKLWALMDRARQDPTTVASPSGWSNDPGNSA